jgi:hypothetical protein
LAAILHLGQTGRGEECGAHLLLASIGRSMFTNVQAEGGSTPFRRA